MGFLEDNCRLKIYNQEIIDNCCPFDCDHPDLNDFFAKEVDNYSKELLGKTYCFVLDNDPTIIVCAFTISNDSIKTSQLPNARKKKVTKDIPHIKQMNSYPAVLIGRLGVHKKYRKIEGEEDSTGTQLMDFIKSWFIEDSNKTGCRFIIVDSYNEGRALGYYRKNGFRHLFSSEEQENKYTGAKTNASLESRLMFFDLIVLTKK